jgi:hypothetical protein
MGYPKVDIGGWYNVDSDTLTDFGYIDFSPDKGNTWYLADNHHGYCLWGPGEELPTFNGNSGGWKHFYYCLDLPVQVNLNDTILYRFTFISDANQTNKDGLMFDNLHFEDWSEGIEELNGDLISIYPNPFITHTTIKSSIYLKNATFVLYNSFGKIVMEILDFSGESITLNRDELTNGLYILEIKENDFVIATKKIMVLDNVN